ncbi:MAG: type II toxin-antitoxin system HicB family antitoxin [Candidatus Dormibacteria bacterium]
MAEVKKRKTYIAKAIRSGEWWAITIPELKGVHSQVRRLNQAEAMGREAIGLYLDVPSDSFDVSVEATLPAAVQADVERAKSVRGQADRLQEEAAGATARAARRLVEGANLTVREAGQILGVSHQRVAQLLHSPRSR